MSMMGIVNLTPDSFSDGGQYYANNHHSFEVIWSHIEPWLNHQIPWLDLGAESTRPGATPVDPETEWQRLVPVLDELGKRDIGVSQISIDSRHPTTQLKSLDYPQVNMINCVAGPKQITNLEHLKHLKHLRPSLHYMAMHLEGEPATMQQQPLDESRCVSSVSGFFRDAYQVLEQLGFDHNHIWLDPGIGFGKTSKACWLLLDYADQWLKDYQLCYGFSRKSFLRDGQQHMSIAKLDQIGKKLAQELLAANKPLIIRTHDPLPLLIKA
ncbi:MAG: dihydropteroate synthase [Proteobacteria bacterium]|nr:dihydropteroate synthase [Pseudomonadota bacterium]